MFRNTSDESADLVWSLVWSESQRQGNFEKLFLVYFYQLISSYSYSIHSGVRLEAVFCITQIHLQLHSVPPFSRNAHSIQSSTFIHFIIQQLLSHSWVAREKSLLYVFFSSHSPSNPAPTFSQKFSFNSKGKKLVDFLKFIFKFVRYKASAPLNHLLRLCSYIMLSNVAHSCTCTYALLCPPYKIRASQNVVAQIHSFTKNISGVFEKTFLSLFSFWKSPENPKTFFWKFGYLNKHTFLWRAIFSARFTLAVIVWIVHPDFSITTIGSWFFGFSCLSAVFTNSVSVSSGDGLQDSWIATLRY